MYFEAGFEFQLQEIQGDEPEDDIPENDNSELGSVTDS